MHRNLPGTIKREAPPGPEMSQAEFIATLSQTAEDAARWRWLRTHFSDVLESWPLERMSGATFQAQVDDVRRALSKPR